MSDLDEQLDRALADGKITIGDADAVREFAEFLADVGPVGTATDRSRAAIAKHHDLVFGGPPPHPQGCPGCTNEERSNA